MSTQLLSTLATVMLLDSNSSTGERVPGGYHCTDRCWQTSSHGSCTAGYRL